MISTDPAERRALIGEYVLGLLEQDQAREVSELIEHDPQAAAMALEWEQHFLELSDRLEPSTPSPGLWPRLQQTLNLGQRASNWQAWWSSLNTWRLTSAALAMALIIALLPMPWRSDVLPPSYTAVLQPPGEAAAPGWVVHIDATGTLLLEPLREDQVAADRSVQFWTLVDPKDGPRSLGLVEPGERLTLSAEQIGAVRAGQLFELTLEPSGGSPLNRPTGEVLYIGRAVVAALD
ncbi:MULTISPECIES: anti-sigma factor [Pseudomonas]|uniref:Anti-sigma-K factor RskA n=2 Tax=Pseudomonadaceae TaxID=135621 RepID=A0A0D0J5H7_9PSED|nr:MULTISPECIES: anti-sigma factor [Pseudomonas]KIQ00826.1 anti-sigma-K factor RskA [Pseudomonas fulva]MCW2292938.1 anti-sigma-K factor RskA [Pseudomonas sp. BIGb0408]NYH72492.1 anti-sigma-K factor RskA [Pseudomonas flavescens]